MRFKDAAYQILHQTGKPLHYNEITDLALAAGLFDTKGRTRYNGQEYSTPSGAAKATGIPWKEVNGWNFWKYWDEQAGQWEKISKVREH